MKTVVPGVDVHPDLYQVVADEILPHIGIASENFWGGFASIVRDLTPTNLALLKKRDDIQSKIDQWYRKGGDNPSKGFLESAGYLVPDQGPLTVNPGVVDPEISTISSPQLVVPVDNARYVLNAANSRWGSLFDAVYGTDVLPASAGAKTGG